MKKSTKVALFCSLFVLIGFPLIFLSVSLYTGNWKYFTASIPGFSAGFIGLMVTLQQMKKEQNRER
ncbi:hypothetical protein ACFDTO_33590 [Microbacteriaceae bacterium 4G12]